ncbi:solute:Na+ symporter, SSS family [Jatrophihabitans endophyticus]|uniref:Solute:Na+ symporter, SSS family n=1 Tax=Jatrophihabitans endophyticus TaxID=1206085 RepID=A0A1M5PA76_9ACTN|nr:sodium:solute symporter family protein [Jatrophihabitans endophyticus]SHG98670.1 solute:Na+ symporter, SSS family [Jatrophihabitans endophyticus]
MLRLHPSVLDIVLLVIYFVAILGIGLAARRSVGTSADFLLAGRALPAWVTGLAFVSANLGATEILGMAANGAQYGVATVHYYWIGAVPAMVFLGIVMMPFYFRSKVRSVPEFLKVRFNNQTHVLNAVVFAVSAVLIAGVNLYALAIVLQSLLGVNLYVGIVVSAAFVLVYIGAGGLSSAIYGEVLQFFVILAGLIPLTIAAVVHVGGFADLGSKVITAFKGNDTALHAWAGTGVGVDQQNPIGANFIGIVLGLGFVLSFGYWTTNFAEVQRALSAKDESAGRRTPLIAAYPKLLIPAVTIIPGLVAVALDPKFGTGGDHLTYNDAIPHLMGDLLPSGVLGIAITGLFASFMAGVAANVSSLNTVVTYDILEPYVAKGRSDRYYLHAGRLVTVAGIVIAVFTAVLASHFNNIMTYLQSLFSIFNAPIFATFILGMFWKKTSAWGGFAGLFAGVVSGAITFLLFQTDVFSAASGIYETFIQAGVAFAVDIVVTLVVTAVTPRPDPATLGDIVYSRHHGRTAEKGPREPWWRRPVLLGGGALAIGLVLNILFA